MVENFMSSPEFLSIFEKCASWTSSLLGAVGGKGIVVSVFILVLVIGMLFVPMRGGRLFNDFQVTSDFVKTKINNKRPIGFSTSSKNSSSGKSTSLGKVKE